MLRFWLLFDKTIIKILKNSKLAGFLQPFLGFWSKKMATKADNGQIKKLCISFAYWQPDDLFAAFWPRIIFPHRLTASQVNWGHGWHHISPWKIDGVKTLGAGNHAEIWGAVKTMDLRAKGEIEQGWQLMQISFLAWHCSFANWQFERGRRVSSRKFVRREGREFIFRSKARNDDWRQIF